MNFKSNVDKIRYYDGNNWNTLIANNKKFEINYEQDFSKYIKSRIGFCYDRKLSKIEIEDFNYIIKFI